MSQQILQEVCQVLVDTVRLAGDHGAPTGVCYAAFSAHGISLDTYTGIVELCKRSGYLEQRGLLLFALPSRGDAKIQA